ncbi:MAG TPA: DUF2071 domain-containing protein [Candidatus Binatia bacterium]|nr:DUF2071 domain-containing protein [Candidatus Binatia bacterium]
MSATAALDRLAMRARPEGTPIMHQRWENLLFLHWSIDPNVLRTALPSELELDTFEDKAWIGITPFALTNVHLTSMPPIPGLNAFEEINVRTCVHYRGIPGIWFFSLDASKVIPAVAARTFFLLPYFKAQVKFEQTAPEFHFSSARIGLPAAHFRATWRTGVRLRDPDLESLAFFLVERYCYFAVQEGAVYATRIYHHPWILDEATVQSHTSTMIGATGIPEPGAAPLAYFSRELEVDIWKPASASSLLVT